MGNRLKGKRRHVVFLCIFVGIPAIPAAFCQANRLKIDKKRPECLFL
ncbi:hypothetical protein [Spirosoma terrae]|uniref:Uncharacterized protein n=1 Tax=Spirosoma terrae TaxID=1968276 RepID=A0A6L9LB02_9BACT|nr:hypothetical protein [Spirosoma terrae]NDU96677.1 hypothetical protein [Spirosoma terrae]